MKNLNGKELFLIAMMLTPFAYLGINYASLPTIVPVHFNSEGIANGFADKSTLWMILGLTGILPYLLLKFLPKIDPKKNFDRFAGTYDKIRWTLAIFTTFLSCFIVYSSMAGNFMIDKKWILMGTALVIAVLGNYLQTVKPNYFVGIRTPWTLESEEVWDKTHRLGGKLIFYSGILTAVVLFFVDKNWQISVFLVGLLSSSFFTVFYSYYISKRVG